MFILLQVKQQSVFDESLQEKGAQLNDNNTNNDIMIILIIIIIKNSNDTSKKKNIYGPLLNLNCY